MSRDLFGDFSLPYGDSAEEILEEKRRVDGALPCRIDRLTGEAVFPEWERHFELREIRREMVEWLDQLRDWEAFATWTWDSRFGARGPSPGRAVSMVEEFLLAEDVATCWWCVEEGRRGGRVHAHGLLRGTGSLDLEIHRKSLWGAWKRRFGRNRIEPVTDSLPVAHYVAKYVSKDFWRRTRDGSLSWGLHAA